MVGAVSTVLSFKHLWPRTLDRILSSLSVLPFLLFSSLLFSSLLFSYLIFFSLLFSSLSSLLFSSLLFFSFLFFSFLFFSFLLSYRFPPVRIFLLREIAARRRWAAVQ